jgi:hypothetical protein
LRTDQTETAPATRDAHKTKLNHNCISPVIVVNVACHGVKLHVLKHRAEADRIVDVWLAVTSRTVPPQTMLNKPHCVMLDAHQLQLENDALINSQTMLTHRRSQRRL